MLLLKDLAYFSIDNYSSICAHTKHTHTHTQTQTHTHTHTHVFITSWCAGFQTNGITVIHLYNFLKVIFLSIPFLYFSLIVSINQTEWSTIPVCVSLRYFFCLCCHFRHELEGSAGRPLFRGGGLGKESSGNQGNEWLLEELALRKIVFDVCVCSLRLFFIFCVQIDFVGLTWERVCKRRVLKCAFTSDRVRSSWSDSERMTGC